MTRRSTLALTAIIVLLVLSACRREDNSIPPIEQQDRIISTATRGDTDSQVVLTWFPVECETFDRVDVDVDDQFVSLTIRVTVDINTCPPSGLNRTVVDIGQPIGDRLIWDRAFNDTVLLEG